MTGYPDDLDIVIDALHGDKREVLKKQVQSIEEEIGQRQLIAIDNSAVVNEEMSELKSESLNLSHMDRGEPDVERKDRLTLEKQRLELSRELREERRDTWKAQRPRREARPYLGSPCGMIGRT